MEPISIETAVSEDGLNDSAPINAMTTDRSTSLASLDNSVTAIASKLSTTLEGSKETFHFIKSTMLEIFPYAQRGELRNPARDAAEEYEARFTSLLWELICSFKVDSQTRFDWACDTLELDLRALSVAREYWFLDLLKVWEKENVYTQKRKQQWQQEKQKPQKQKQKQTQKQKQQNATNDTVASYLANVQNLLVNDNKPTPASSKIALEQVSTIATRNSSPKALGEKTAEPVTPAKQTTLKTPSAEKKDVVQDQKLPCAFPDNGAAAHVPGSQKKSWIQEIQEASHKLSSLKPKAKAAQAHTSQLPDSSTAGSQQRVLPSASDNFAVDTDEGVLIGCPSEVPAGLLDWDDDWNGDGDDGDDDDFNDMKDIVSRSRPKTLDASDLGDDWDTCDA